MREYNTDMKNLPLKARHTKTNEKAIYVIQLAAVTLFLTRLQSATVHSIQVDYEVKGRLFSSLLDSNTQQKSC